MERVKLDRGLPAGRQGARALVIVAHPDDETIWMGGTIARHKRVRWNIFVLCRKSDPDRMPKFKRVAKHYRARGLICDLEDEGVMSIQKSIPAIQRIIRTELFSARGGWDVVFTHGANGEYGHPRHKGVHRAVKEMLKTGELKAKAALFFAYRLDEKRKIAVPQENAAYGVELSGREWRAKRDVIQEFYGFEAHSFENRSCAPIETFRKHV